MFVQRNSETQYYIILMFTLFKVTMFARVGLEVSPFKWIGFTLSYVCRDLDSPG